MKKKSITITDQQESWIQAQMATGNYGTDSELIREALREKQNRTAEIEHIRAKLIEGEQSGGAEPFDAVEFKKEMAAQPHQTDRVRSENALARHAAAPCSE